MGIRSRVGVATFAVIAMLGAFVAPPQGATASTGVKTVYYEAFIGAGNPYVMTLSSDGTLALHVVLWGNDYYDTGTWAPMPGDSQHITVVAAAGADAPCTGTLTKTHDGFNSVSAPATLTCASGVWSGYAVKTPLTRTRLAVQPRKSVAGTDVSLTATVTSHMRWGTPGTVSFYDGDVYLGSADAGPACSNACFTATLTAHFTVIGFHSLHATYDGDPMHAPSTTSVMRIQVSAP